MEMYVTISAISTDDPSSVIFKLLLFQKKLSRYHYAENSSEP